MDRYASDVVLAGSPELSSGTHSVQFYESDASLITALSGFVAEGLRRGERCLLVATPEHIAGLDTRLREDGADLGGARADQRCTVLDARQTLAAFLVDGVPDQRRFLEVVGSAVRTLTSDGRRLRVFGEMVALLWADGHAEAALRLEGYWNELLRSTAFSLFCAYPLSAFPLSSDGPGFSQVCDRHGVIIPAESYADRRDADDRTRHIAVLQQKALSLESEMAQRSELQERLSARERELRDFLEHAVVPLHQVGPDGRILWANKAELDLLGYQPDEYIGRHIADFHVDRDVIDDMLARLLRGEALYDHPARMRAKDGSIKHVLIHSNGCFDGDRFLYTRCFTRDITERRRIEDERDRLLKQLEDERRRLNHLHVELQEKIRDLEEFHDCVVGRELKMIELQEEVETYRAKLRELGQPV